MNTGIITRPLRGLVLRAGSRRDVASTVGALSMKASTCGDKALFEGMQRWIDKCNTGSVDGFIPLQVAGVPIGFVAPDIAKKLAGWVCRCAAL